MAISGQEGRTGKQAPPGPAMGAAGDGGVDAVLEEARRLQAGLAPQQDRGLFNRLCNPVQQLAFGMDPDAHMPQHLRRHPASDGQDGQMEPLNVSRKDARLAQLNRGV